jgi:hypothetical protein
MGLGEIDQVPPETGTMEESSCRPLILHLNVALNPLF